MSYKKLFSNIGKNLSNDFNIFKVNVVDTFYAYMTPSWRKTRLTTKELDSIRQYSKTCNIIDLKSDKNTQQLLTNWIENNTPEFNHYDSYSNLLIVQSSDGEYANEVLDSISYYYKEIRSDKVGIVIDFDFKWVNKFTRYESFSLYIQDKLQEAIRRVYGELPDKLLEVGLALFRKRYDAGFFKSVILYQLESLLNNDSLFRTCLYDVSYKEELYLMVEDGYQHADPFEYLTEIIAKLETILKISKTEIILSLISEYSSIMELESRNANFETLNNLEVS